MSDFGKHHDALGLADGEARGESKGKVEGEAQLVLRQSDRRVGLMDAKLQAKVMALPLDALVAMGEALLDFASLADLEAWLAAH